MTEKKWMFGRLKEFLQQYLGKWWWVVFPIAVIPFIAAYGSYQVWLYRMKAKAADGEKELITGRGMVVESDLESEKAKADAAVISINSRAERNKSKVELEHNKKKEDIKDEAEKEKHRIASDDDSVDDAVDDLLS